MKTKQLLISGLILMGGINGGLFAQSGPDAAGGDATGAGGKVSYSIGQTDYIYATGSGGSVNQGLQQPYKIFVSTGIEEKNISLDFKVYPNPTVDNLTLTVSNRDTKNLKYTLYSLEGKLIHEEMISQESTTISMAELAQGLYIVSVYDKNKTIKSFNVIKK